MSSLPLAVLAGSGGFSSDPRFCMKGAPPLPVTEPEDHEAAIVAAARAETRAEVLAEFEATQIARDAARSRVELALARLNAEQQELLRQRLMVTIEELCEAAIAPLALDRNALAARVARAAAMLSRADDEKLLRLHPDDIALIAARLPEGLEILADPGIERGALRLETRAGGVEDGPAHWRRAIAEALAQC